MNLKSKKLRNSTSAITIGSKKSNGSAFNMVDNYDPKKSPLPLTYMMLHFTVGRTYRKLTVGVCAGAI